MRRQQEIRYPLLHGILVPAPRAHELALVHLRLEQEFVQGAQCVFAQVRCLSIFNPLSTDFDEPSCCVTTCSASRRPIVDVHALTSSSTRTQEPSNNLPWQLKSHLTNNRTHGSPFDAWEQRLPELGLEVEVCAHELGVADV